MAKGCGFCGSTTHTAFNCRRRRRPLKNSPFKSKRTHLRPESSSSRNKRRGMAKKRFRDNPPDWKGGYTCYLQVSSNCPKWISRHYVTLEHIYPKASYPELKYVTLNIKPSCADCNRIKKGNTLEKLSIIYPQLLTMIKSEDWRRFVARLSEYSSQLKQELDSQ
jgi:5-methylcytosine-specific restriction endonuclease McrA